MQIQWITVFLLMVFASAGLWKTFEKAGYAGWKALVPVYNIYILTRIAGRPVSWTILCIIPLVNIVFFSLLCIDIAALFGKDTSFGFGLVFFGFVFWPMLGFGNAKFIKSTGA